MSDLGQLLRKARLEKGISLEELQETTKIRKRYLEAIEEGNYTVLPGNFYVRAFIKSYAEAVGLDPNEVLRLFQNVLPTSSPELSPEPIIRKRVKNKSLEKWSKLATVIMLWSFLLLIIGLIYYFIHMNYNGSIKKNIVTEDQSKHLTNKTVSDSAYGVLTPKPEENKQDVPEVKEPILPSKPEVKLVKSEKGTDYYSVIKSAKISVQMTVIGENCWIELDKLTKVNDTINKEMMEQKTYVKGDSKSWEQDQSIYIILGRANAVELKVNGMIIPVGDSPNVKRIQVDLT